MDETEKRIAFGPVPSRRLGRSLGINNIPPKICTYSCVYCQLGKTHHVQTSREPFYSPVEIRKAVEKTVRETLKRQEHIEYLTFVPDGEPTLDNNLGDTIVTCRQLGIKTAVITNASLLWQEEVRRDLLNSDYVSLKIDAVHEDIWRRINRPSKSVQLDTVLEGIIDFSHEFTGKLVTETMLIHTLNDTLQELTDIASFIAKVHPQTSYIALPIRPPAEKWVQTPDEKTITMAHEIFRKKSLPVEYLIGYEGNTFASTGNPREDILNITMVHPMKQEAIQEVLKKARKKWDVIETLLSEKKLVEIIYNKETFYLRKLPHHKKKDCSCIKKGTA